MEFSPDWSRYLARINYHDEPSVSLDCLRGLHRHHLMAVPFEATDIHFGRAISLEPRAIYDKVVNRRRGGFCYELNSLFCGLLREIGFTVRMVSAQVNNDGVFGPPFDHLSLVVELEGLWLADVGFGDLFLEPLRIQPGTRQLDRDHDYRLERAGEDTFCLLAAAPDAADFEPKYRFDLRPRRIEDFAEQCRITQQSPESHFVRNFICTLPTPTGRKTIRNGVFKERAGDVVTEHEIKDEAEMIRLLAAHFGMHPSAHLF